MVDDDEMVRALLHSSMQVTEGLCWVGEAPNGELGVDLALRREPDAVILDLEMPGIDGVETVRRLRGCGYAGVIAMHTSKPTDAVAAMELGADAIFRKDRGISALMTAVRDLCVARSRVERIS